MKVEAVLAVIAAYFAALLLIGRLTSSRRGAAASGAFFNGGRQSPWWVVAISMIGTSISGVTFVSVPGMVEASQFSYMQMVLGFIVGYAAVAFVLLPLYYRLDLKSIYSYLGMRFGESGRKVGAVFFLISKYLGCGVRMFLTASVLQLFVFDPLGVPFWANAAVTMLIVWAYTRRGGVRTIVWADALQTLAMLGAVALCLIFTARVMGLGFKGLCSFVADSPLSRTWFFDDPLDRRYFWKQFLAGAFTVVAMTGLDQDMMQKNLSCRNLREARRNVLSYGVAFVPVNLLFLSLGVLLFKFKEQAGVPVDGPDSLFPVIATGYMPAVCGVLFILGLVAAGFSSAGSALTALTSSITLDILGAEKKGNSVAAAVGRAAAGGAAIERTTRRVHAVNAVAMAALICALSALRGGSVINAIYTIAGYTYGPLLGLFLFGMCTRLRPRRLLIAPVCIAAPLLTWLLATHSEQWFGGYQMGFEVLLVNAALTFLGLLASSRKA